MAKQQDPRKAVKSSLVKKIMDNPVKVVRKLINVTEPILAERRLVWDRYRRKYRRGLYYLKQLEGGVPLYFTNYIFANIEATKANMTRNLPPLAVRPKGAGDDVAAELLSRVLDNELREANLKGATKAVVHHGLTATVGWFKVYFNYDTDRLCIEGYPPDDILVDPKAHTLKDARWIIHRHRDVPVEEIFHRYGEVPTRVKSDEDKSESSHNDNISTQSKNGVYGIEESLHTARDVSPTMDVYECWVRSWEFDRENDWYIVTIAGDTVLRQEYSVYSHNKTPFVPWFDVEDYAADNIYYRGVGSVEEIEPLQDRADALDLRIYKNISLMSNRQRYVSAQSGLNVNAVDTTAGRSYQVNGDPSKAVYYDNPPQLGTDVYGYRNQTELLIQTVSGIFDVTQGRRPIGITAGRAIESLKDSAETRLSSKAESLAEALREVGNLSLSIILQFYDGVRLIRSVDGDVDQDILIIDDYPESLQPQVEFQTDEEGNPVLDEDGNPIMIGEPGEVDEELRALREQWKQENGIALVLSDVTFEWDVEASADSALPSARAERAQIAADLFRLGAIDRMALLEAMDYPQRHKILRRLEAQVTGKNAGDPNAEAGVGQIEQMIATVEQTLRQMGMADDQIQAVVEAMVASQQSGQTQQQGGNFPPQMTM